MKNTFRHASDGFLLFILISFSIFVVIILLIREDGAVSVGHCPQRLHERFVAHCALAIAEKVDPAPRAACAVDGKDILRMLFYPFQACDIHHFTVFVIVMVRNGRVPREAEVDALAQRPPCELDASEQRAVTAAPHQPGSHRHEPLILHGRLLTVRPATP